MERKKTLNVFDIDDTLFYVDVKIKVKKSGKIIKEISGEEFQNYELKFDEQYDFSDLRCARTFRSTSIPIEKVFNLAKKVINTNDGDTILLTAREDYDDRDTFLQKFRDHDFPIDLVYVERSGNVALKYSVKANVSKIFVLRKYIKLGKYNHIRVWDDSERNLRSILKLTKYHPDIIIDTYLVKKDGMFEKFESEMLTGKVY